MQRGVAGGTPGLAERERSSHRPPFNTLGLFDSSGRVHDNQLDRHINLLSHGTHVLKG